MIFHCIETRDGSDIAANDDDASREGAFYDPLDFVEDGTEPEGDNIDSAPNGQDDGREEEVDEPSEDSNAAASDIFDEQGRFIRFDFVIEFEVGNA